MILNRLIVKHLFNYGQERKEKKNIDKQNYKLCKKK